MDELRVGQRVQIIKDEATCDGYNLDAFDLTVGLIGIVTAIIPEEFCIGVYNIAVDFGDEYDSEVLFKVEELEVVE